MQSKKHFKVGQAAELLGVSSDTVRRWIDEGLLNATRSPGGHREIHGSDLAQFVANGSHEHRLTNVSQTSARNRFLGLVINVVKGDVMTQVELVSGSHRLVSLMSTQSADELGLEPGMMAVASVKSTVVTVEVPAVASA